MKAQRMMTPSKISFCTWNLNRADQLRQTLPQNLAMADRFEGEVEFCVLDLGSRDGSRELLADLSRAEPRLVYRRLDGMPVHFARNYNAAHRLASGDVMVTLDADNWIGERFCDTLATLYRHFGDAFVVHAFDGDWFGGTCGRLAMSSRLFERVGGYDESFEPVMYQDIDLRNRAVAAGGILVSVHDASIIGGAVRNSLDDRYREMDANVDAGRVMHRINRQRSRRRLRSGVYRVNVPGED